MSSSPPPPELALKLVEAVAQLNIAVRALERLRATTGLSADEREELSVVAAVEYLKAHAERDRVFEQIAMRDD